jgi:predicted Zn-dependent protease
LSQGDLVKAGSALQQVLEEDPSRAAAWCALGQVYLGMGDPDRAVDVLCRAASLEPRSTVIQFYLAWAEVRRGNEAEARAAFMRLLLLHPSPDLAQRAMAFLSQE